MRHSKGPTEGINIDEETRAGIYHYPRLIPDPLVSLSRRHRGRMILRQPNRVFMDQTDKIHLENMRRNLERRLEVAQARGDKDLVNLLQQESLALIFMVAGPVLQL